MLGVEINPTGLFPVPVISATSLTIHSLESYGTEDKVIKLDESLLVGESHN